MAEFERLVMHRQDEAGTRHVGHFEGLFRRAVAVDPRIVGADGHDREVERAVAEGAALAAQSAKGGGEARVAAVEQRDAVAAQNVAGVTPVIVVAHPRAPVANLESLDLDLAVVGRHGGGGAAEFEAGRFAPSEFRDVAREPGAAEKVVRAAGGDDERATVKTAQGGKVKVIHVRVAEQDQIDGREFVEAKGGGDVAFGANNQRPDRQPRTCAEDGVGEDVDAVEVEEDRRMAEPSGGDLVVAPGFGVRLMRGGKDAASGVVEDDLQVTQARAGKFRQPQAREGECHVVPPTYARSAGG